ncbi:ribonuclease P protein component [Hamadaea tsunoensis]|uniref:ribonuclease P protein component n=1 Tax=Hamadaea tsunoensis TaxID=53368 RepID=UPI000481D91F|nr:ribonuclease P protein component [Hamadaea tsunoensis]
MLPAANRLRHSSDFAVAVRSGRRVGRGAVVVHVNVATKPGGEQLPGFVVPAPRAGFVVSKAVGPAVVRNKVKRRLRHLVAERLHDYPAGTTLIVRALPAAAGAAYADLARDLDAALDAAKRPRRTEARR